MHEVISAAEEVWTATNEWVAPELSKLARALGQHWVNERDHMAPCLRKGLPHVARHAASPSPAVSMEQHEPQLVAEWPRVGAVDAILRWPGAEGRANDAARVFGELKCGSDTKALSGCAWDAPKCVYAMRLRLAIGAHLIAGAPQRMWEGRRGRPALGVEMLLDGVWEMADVRIRYATHWRRWERDGYKPLRVPAVIRTTAVNQIEFIVGGEPWMLGVARVDDASDPDDWFDWAPVVS